MYPKKPKQRKWYSEVCIGVRKIVKVGDSRAVIIPKGYFKTGKLKDKQECVVILLFRDRTISDEMNKKEFIQYEAFKRYKEQEDEELKKIEKSFKK